MSTALLLADAEPTTKGFLERHLPSDGFELVDQAPDLVLAGDVETVEQWRDQAPVIVLGRSDADVVDRVHAFRRGCDDYVSPPFDYQELVGGFASMPAPKLHLFWLNQAVSEKDARRSFGQNWPKRTEKSRNFCSGNEGA